MHAEEPQGERAGQQQRGEAGHPYVVPQREPEGVGSPSPGSLSAFVTIPVDGRSTVISSTRPIPGTSYTTVFR
ncbi:hypothetical protein OG357_36850 [Streptomyces sp. NBC_01255]|uniref:hypothetical protein n=1 Tax=Streptomyces sp. NBC_01255 TaxID=2903798 RepID=UPI002E2F070B|nr:hypothetical protein [Streptomyces sp. NBC_01255]